ncbi:hypothetical protein ASG87_02355 [Frateuria sp. Soil773]|uniref:hypothetical protein n=1 Tax=Frateuria sp. Soil773 TaxID=1736407 RepID=UPI0006F64ACB|nr:hypothetical protein [Frateuria sp. Soil773]KRE89966.1 hypothetical protein ASG87_02355 [Frateuria sp. Soil773]
MSRVRFLPGWLGGLAALGFCAALPAQSPPTLTGNAVANRLDAAVHGLSVRAADRRDTGLDATGQRLARMAADLRGSLPGRMGEPAATLDGPLQARLLRADAAARRTQAYLDVSDGCPGGEAKAMAAALELGVARLEAGGPGKVAPPVIDAVETPDRRPLFAVRPGRKPPAFALAGTNLSDPQCAGLSVSATDADGTPLRAQPMVTDASPARIELEWPSGAALDPGSVVLHVASRRKVFLLGCVAQPEAVAAIRVLPPLKFSASYTLDARCRIDGRERDVAVAAGTLPDLAAYDAAVSQPVDTSACADPVSYAVSVKATYADGSQAAAGPIVQDAGASITAGLPGGLSVNWNPAMRTLFMRSGANRCKGVD